MRFFGLAIGKPYLLPSDSPFLLFMGAMWPMGSSLFFGFYGSALQDGKSLAEFFSRGISQVPVGTSHELLD